MSNEISRIVFCLDDVCKVLCGKELWICLLLGMPCALGPGVTRLFFAGGRQPPELALDPQVDPNSN